MSAGFDWPALMRAGIGGLGLAPEVFWRLGPAELLMLLGEGGAAPMGRNAFEALAARFPDETRGEAADGTL
jgi:uncharacterized phage protein (TIGR02216 family)